MKFQVGKVLIVNERPVRIVASSGSAVTLRDSDSGSILSISFDELVRVSRPAPDASPSVADDLVILRHLDDAGRGVAEFWGTFLHEFEVSLENAADLGNPRMAVYAQALVDLRARGHDISERTLRRKYNQFRARGAAGVVPARRSTRRVDAQIVSALAEVMEGETLTSTGTRGRLIHKTKVLVEQRAGDEIVKFPSRTTWYRLIDEMDRGRFVTGSAHTRRSLANRPDRPFAAMGASYPGEQVQIDSTKLDIFVRLPNGKAVRPELTLLLDVATRTVPAAIIRPIGTKSIDLVVLLAKALVPFDQRPGGRAETRALVSGSLSEPLLSDAEIAEHMRNMPYIFPETITTDRGAIFESAHFKAACARLRINLNESAPYTPTDKGKVERMFKTINTGFVQYLAGYTGRSVDHRGAAAETEQLWALHQLQELLDEWIAVEWQNRPHDALRDPLFPSIQLSPNEMARAHRRLTAEQPIPFDEKTYLSLMPVHWRSIQQYGITIDNRTYDSAALAPIRRMRSPHKGHGSQWPIHYDPYNIQTVWLQIEGEWIPLTWQNAHVTGPLSDELWAISREPGFLNRQPAAEARRAQHIRRLLTREAEPDKKQTRAIARSKVVERDPMRLSESIPAAEEVQSPQRPESRLAPVSPITLSRFGLLDDSEWETL